MVRSEGIGFRVIKREHAHHAGQSFQRNRQRRAQRAELGRIVQISRLDRGIAVDDGFAVLRHPAGEALPQRNAQRREQAEVVAADMLRNQFLVRALHRSRWHRRAPAACSFTENTDSVSPRLSEAPRSWLSSNSVCASCRAAAIDERNVASWPGASLTVMSSNPAAGAAPRFHLHFGRERAAACSRR